MLCPPCSHCVFEVLSGDESMGRAVISLSHITAEPSLEWCVLTPCAWVCLFVLCSPACLYVMRFCAGVHVFAGVLGCVYVLHCTPGWSWAVALGARL